MTNIQKYLLSQADPKYRAFTLPVIPNVDEKTFIERRRRERNICLSHIRVR